MSDASAALVGLFVWFLIVFAVVGLLRARRLGPTLVLRQFTVGTDAAGRRTITIRGRRGGLLGWLLTMLGLSSESRLSVAETRLSLQKASLLGEFWSVCPLARVASTHCGHAKPIELLLLALMLFLGGVAVAISAPWAALGLFLLAGVCTVAYALLKWMVISVETFGASTMGLRFRPSVIEGVAVDTQKVRQAVELLNQLVMEAQGRP